MEVPNTDERNVAGVGNPWMLLKLRGIEDLHTECIAGANQEGFGGNRQGVGGSKSKQRDAKQPEDSTHVSSPPRAHSNRWNLSSRSTPHNWLTCDQLHSAPRP